MSRGTSFNRVEQQPDSGADAACYCCAKAPTSHGTEPQHLYSHHDADERDPHSLRPPSRDAFDQPRSQADDVPNLDVLANIPPACTPDVRRHSAGHRVLVPIPGANWCGRPKGLRTGAGAGAGATAVSTANNSANSNTWPMARTPSSLGCETGHGTSGHLSSGDNVLGAFAASGVYTPQPHHDGVRPTDNDKLRYVGVEEPCSATIQLKGSNSRASAVSCEHTPLASETSDMVKMPAVVRSKMLDPNASDLPLPPARPQAQRV